MNTGDAKRFKVRTGRCRPGDSPELAAHDPAKEAAIRLLRKMQITGTDKELDDACDKFGCRALSLTLRGSCATLTAVTSRGSIE